jgi:hypothetical protein
MVKRNKLLMKWPWLFQGRPIVRKSSGGKAERLVKFPASKATGEPVKSLMQFIRVRDVCQQL